MDPAMAVEVAAMSRQRALMEAIGRGDSDIQNFYRHSTVFLTGASGFMGKQMMEKLFRSCELSKLFILLRPKKGKKVQERLNVIFQDPVFEPLRTQQPNFEQKVVAIEGDVAEVRLGACNQDWETLTNEVNVIIHMAATTRFDESLRLATLINVRGTREVITLGKACKKLKSFVHVSTAYSFALEYLIKQEVYEKFYPSPIPPETLISMTEDMDADRFNGLTMSLIQDWPNTYTFTKAVAEDLIRTMTDGLPISIVRPGVVIGAYREPLPGWIDISCAYGATGLILSAGLGVLHVVLNRPDTKCGLVPCDYVNNAIITAGKFAKNSYGGNATKIYTVNSNVRNPFTHGMLSELAYNARFLTSPRTVYYSFAFETPNKVLFTLLTWLLHIIPAHIMDFVCLLLGKERRFVKLSKKIHNMTNVLSYFTMNDWLFVDKNLQGLYSSLSEIDKTIFNFDITNIDWTEYISIWWIGIRKYIVKDGLKGTEAGIRKQFWFKLLHYIISSVYLFCIWKFFSFIFFVLSSLISLLFVE